MDQSIDIFPAVIGIILIGIGIGFEIRWWSFRLRHYTKTVGTVIDREVKPEIAWYPIIQYMHKDQGHKFVSPYESHANIGKEVVLLVSPDGNHAVHYTLANRWAWTIVPIFLGLFALYTVWERGS